MLKIFHFILAQFPHFNHHLLMRFRASDNQSVCFTRKRGYCGVVSDCEELVGEVNHTTECVTDLAKSISVLRDYCRTPSERNVG